MTTCLNRYGWLFPGVIILLGVLMPGSALAATVEVQPLGNFLYMAGTDSASPQINIDPLQGKSAGTNGMGEILSLSEVLRYALERNRNIEIAAYQPLQAEQDLRRYRSVYDPVAFAAGSTSQVDRPVQSQLDTGSILDDALTEDRWLVRAGVKSLVPSGATVSLYQEIDYLDSSSSLIFPNPQGTSRVTAQLNQPLLKGIGDWENRTAIKVARLNVNISNEDFRQTVMDVVANAALTYWQLAQDQQVIDIARRYLDKTKDIYQREHYRLGRGLAKELDVARIAANLDSRLSELILLQKQAKTTEKRLQLLINAPGLFVVPRQLKVDMRKEAILNGVNLDHAMAESEALQYRPELERVRRELQVAELNKGLAKLDRLPTLDFQASYSKNALDDEVRDVGGDAYESDKDSWTLGLNFEIPLGNRAANSQYRRTEFDYRRKLAEYEQVKETIIFEVNQALTDLELAQAEVEAAERARETALKVVEGENALFELARADTSDLLQAQNQLDLAERKLTQGLVAFSRARIVLNRAKGTLLNEFGVQLQ